jgi:hypothetical protein
MRVRSEIIDIICDVAAEQNVVLAPLTDDLRLAESGLDSLCLAVLVARLEDRFGSDPFAAVEYAAIPTTLGDFIGVYELAFA